MFKAGWDIGEGMSNYMYKVIYNIDIYIYIMHMLGNDSIHDMTLDSSDCFVLLILGSPRAAFTKLGAIFHCNISAM